MFHRNEGGCPNPGEKPFSGKKELVGPENLKTLKKTNVIYGKKLVGGYRITSERYFRHTFRKFLLDRFSSFYSFLQRRLETVSLCY